MTSLEQHLTEREVAQILGDTLTALRGWRLRKIGPRYTKLGKLVRYPESAVTDFIAAGMREPQS